MRTFLTLFCTMALVVLGEPVHAQSESANERYTAAREPLDAQDYETAFPLINSLCQEGYREACRVGALLLSEGLGVERNVPLAMDVLVRLCSPEMPAACEQVDKLFDAKLIPETDYAAIAENLISRCTADQIASACRYRGRVHEDGLGTPKDLTAALTAYQSGCDLGSAAACTDIGQLYSGGFPVSRGVDYDTGPVRDFTLAVTYYRVGCDKGHGVGCAFLADAIAYGRGAEKDIPAALEMFRKAEAMDLPRWARTSVEGEIRRFSAQLEAETQDQ